MLSQASRAGVENAFLQLRPNMLQGVWLGGGNSYRDDTIARLKRDLKNRSVDDAHLSQYVASSVLLHCADGWSFLGRALDALARGDSNTARHAGYYAELRAAMSLLASEGIGIFGQQHFILERSGHCAKLPPLKNGNNGTHVITWQALNYWAGLGRAAMALSEIITAGGIRLDEWLRAFRPGFGVGPIAQKLLTSWGLDLQRMSSDRDARNEVSYRPTRLNSRASLDVLDASTFLREFWTVCEPGGQSRFEFLDRHLVRASLEAAYEATFEPNDAVQQPDFSSEISAMLEQAATSDSMAGEWLDFFTRKEQPETPLVIREAKSEAPTSDPRHHLQVLSRAVLLLRIATGACLRLLLASGSSLTDLRFWWKVVGEERGLWRPNDEPEQLADLWTDIETAIGAIRDWENKTTPPNRSIAAWRSSHANEISMLGECERVALWGIEP